MTSTALVPVRRRRVVTFRGGPAGSYRLRRLGLPVAEVVYDVPVNTCDPRYSACTVHRVACDCREAEHAEEVGELRHEWAVLRDTARRALGGHQLEYPLGLTDLERLRFPLCLCSGCVIARDHGAVLRVADVDLRTGRVYMPDPPVVTHPADSIPF